MRSSYKPIGRFIRLVKTRNAGLEVTELRGIRINKEFMPSVANVIGTDLENYKVVRKNQFAYNPMHVGRDGILPIAQLDSEEPVIVSPAYVVFEIGNPDELLPEYLMMWCRRPEFDRQAWFTTDSSVRGGFDWKDFCEMEMPVPSPEKQREIVAEYETVVKRIALNEKLGRKLEETAQAIYKHWFVDFEFPMSDEDAKKLGRPELEGKTYQSSGGEMVMCEKLNTAKPVLWGTQSLSQCIDKTSSITYGVVKPGSADPDGVKFVRSGDLLNGRILTDQLRTIESEVSDHYRRTLLSGGEVLLSIVGNPGQVAIVPASLKGANIARQVALLKMRDSDIALFIKSFLLSPIGRDALGVITLGSVQKVINLKDLRNLPVLLPSPEHFKKFGKISEITESLSNSLHRQIELLDKIRLLLFARMTRLKD